MYKIVASDNLLRLQRKNIHILFSDLFMHKTVKRSHLQWMARVFYYLVLGCNEFLYKQDTKICRYVLVKCMYSFDSCVS